MGTWYSKTEKCDGCLANECMTTPLYIDENSKVFQCPCVLCIVKVMCNSYCSSFLEYSSFEYNRTLKSKGTKIENSKHS